MSHIIPTFITIVKVYNAFAMWVIPIQMLRLNSKLADNGASGELGLVDLLWIDFILDYQHQGD